MILNKYRSANACNYEKTFKAYVINNFNENTFKTIQPLITDLQQLRNVIGNFPISYSKEQFDHQIGLMTSYLHCLNEISYLPQTGKNKDSISFSFSWNEVTINKKNTSSSIDLEICSVKYNLAVAFCMRAELLKKSKNELEIKESLKDYQRAAFAFIEVKDIYLNKLLKEGISDFAESYMDININYCLGMANVCIVDICIKKNLEDGLKSKLAMAAYHYFNKSTNVTLSIKFDKCYYTHLRYYYQGYAYYYHYSQKINDVINKAKGIGGMIGILQYALELLNNSLNEKSKLSSLINEFSINNLINEIESKIKELKSKNDKFYYENIPNRESLPVIDMDLEKVKPTKYDIDVSNKNIHLLNVLFPENASIVQSFSSKIEKYVVERSSKYHNDNSIKVFLSERNLLDGIERGNVQVQVDLPDHVWDDIQEINQKGGYKFILNEIESIEKKSEEIMQQIQAIQKTLFQDNEENNKLKILYGEDWTLINNDSYFIKINDLKGQISSEDNENIIFRNKLIDNSYNYGLLNLPRQEIANKIPSKPSPSSTSNLSSISSNPEIKSIKDSLNELKDLQAKLNQAHFSIFSLLKNTLQSEEIQKYKNNLISENALFDEMKAKYESLFKDLESIHKDIQTCLEKIDQQYHSLKNPIKSISTDNNASKFFSNMKYIFCGDVNFLSKKMVFYTAMAKKVHILQDDVEGFIFARKFDKDDLIRNLESKQRKLYSQNASKN